MDKRSDAWVAYARQAKRRPPHAALKEAARLAAYKGAALDMGAGALNETIYLLKDGFKKVVALDAEPGIAEEAAALQEEGRLEAVVSRFEEYAFPEESFDLVNAHYSLPFISPGSFDQVFSRMKASLKPGGVFVGQLFGENDYRNGRKNITTHSRESIERLFAGLELLELREEEYDGPTSSGVRHWHVWHILARKK